MLVMNPHFSFLLLPVAVIAGILGAILGLGGGIIMVPFLTLVFGVDIQVAIAASLVSIVATSSGAAASYLRDRLTNLRLAVLLEVGTVLGAITGVLLHKIMKASSLFYLFAFFLIWSAYMMAKKKNQLNESVGQNPHPWATKLKLNGEFKDGDGIVKPYFVEKVPFGVLGMYGAGVLSALLGIGSGSLKVLVMDGMMKLPIKVSSATSNFMIGVTAAASAGAFMLEGKIDLRIAVPMALGILIGSFLGAKLMIRMPASLIRKLFVYVLVFLGLQMMWKGWHG